MVDGLGRAERVLPDLVIGERHTQPKYWVVEAGIPLEPVTADVPQAAQASKVTLHDNSVARDRYVLLLLACGQATVRLLFGWVDGSDDFLQALVALVAQDSSRAPIGVRERAIVDFLLVYLREAPLVELHVGLEDVDVGGRA